MSNVDWDPNEIIVKAEAESIAWKKAQERLEMAYPHTETHVEISVLGDIWDITSSGRAGSSHLGYAMYVKDWKLTMVFQTDCSDVVKMISKPEEWPAFSLLLEEVDRCKRRFNSFSIMQIPRTENTKADKLARSDRALPTNVYYVNSVSPVWISELF
ncbi:unnamed protein product [Microthlaspi erraticum]|uniref:RNase H type-1 domain-containing protein n=1 Tax=Microthlaspi erraticum TaxID=1685480 RepID=A0A6D2HSV0_9BRAS|nr:unnamed protein product [Microthlaspi erraticum]